MNISLWMNEINLLIQQLDQLDLGYPLGDNIVRYSPQSELLKDLLAVTNLPNSAPIISFFNYCNGIELPDIHVGYFIHKIELILDNIKSQKIVALSGNLGGKILVFGSDGGGGLFALKLDGLNQVLYLPVGRVENGCFDGITTPVKVLANDFESFLLCLKSDVKNFVNQTKGWVYMTENKAIALVS